MISNKEREEQLYHNTCQEVSTLITQRYSTSFSLGIKTLSKKIHPPLYAIYGFVRLADEIVDTFHQYDKKALLEKFKQDTYQSITDGISFNPVLHAFQRTVNHYTIDTALIGAFFHSMEMDLHHTVFTEESYKHYIYGSAEVIGLICLCVFTDGDKEQYANLSPYAKSLGAAFQKVNFLRDMRADYEERGRVYFPGVLFDSFSTENKKSIEEDIQKELDYAHIGIKKLPQCAKKGVLLAYLYYDRLLKHIIKSSVEEVKKNRIRVPNIEKKMLMLKILLFD